MSLNGVLSTDLSCVAVSLPRGLWTLNNARKFPSNQRRDEADGPSGWRLKRPQLMGMVFHSVTCEFGRQLWYVLVGRHGQ